MIWLARFLLGTLVYFWLSALVRAIRSKKDDEYRVTKDTPPPVGAPSVGVVVPARNEVDNIGACVDAILAQSHASLRLVVLNDGSTDGTEAALAKRSGDARLSVVQGGGGALPENWLGKAWACQRAAKHLLDGEDAPDWLLFVDADVVLHPHAVSGVLGHAIANDLAMLSGLGRLVMESFWEKVMQPVVAGLIMAGNDLQKVNDPEQRDERPLANGQFILVRSDAYLAVGGHEAVRQDVLDDVGMATAITLGGYPYHLVFMRDLFDCRMYTSLSALWEGWTKNLFAGIHQSWFNLSVLVILLAWSALFPYGLLAWGLVTGAHEWAWWGGGIALLIQSVRLWLDVQLGQDVRYGPTQPLGVLLMITIFIHSGIRASRGTAEWKGRTVPIVKPTTHVEDGSDST